MSDDYRVRCCAILYLQPCESTNLDFAALLTGQDALRSERRWQAFAPHLGRTVELDVDAVHALGRISHSRWSPRADVAAAVGEERLQALVDAGLVLIDNPTAPLSETEQRLRDTPWHPLAAMAHMYSRWSDIDSITAQRESRIQSVPDLVRECGPPPPHFHTRIDAQVRAALPCPQPNGLDALFARRATCRNFDTAVSLTQAQLGSLLHRVFGVQGREELAPGAVALKKNHPSGGALHPLEAYLIVRRAEGLAIGLYHYNAEAHALDLLSALSAEAAHALALSAVAGQDYFADAPALAVVTARFTRSFWKYRNHPKIYRAILLEAGHASQNLYLAATDMGMGAFITAAINEVEIEQAFGLDPLEEGPLAVCGFGPRAAERRTVEFDPLNWVWPA